MYTGTRPGVSPVIRAGKGWRGRRELAPRCSATQLSACLCVHIDRDMIVIPSSEPHTPPHPTPLHHTTPHHTTPHHTTPHHTTVSKPECLADAHFVVVEELLTNAQIHLHNGKTQVQNRGGAEPRGMPELTRAARAVKPGALVWRGDPGLPLSEKGLKVLGIPIGQPALVSDFLERKSMEQQTLFQRIPWVNDPQPAFLLLLMCGSTKAMVAGSAT